MATTFGPLAGSWSGTNGFRLMPTDELFHAPAGARLTTAAGGHCLVLTYTWTHPDDGPQDGVLLAGSAPEGDEGVSAAWGDGWHQKPALLILTGTVVGHRLSLDAEYGGGWRWAIELDGGGDDVLRLTMYNVVPDEYATQESPAGPYPVMVGELQRASDA